MAVFKGGARIRRGERSGGIYDRARIQHETVMCLFYLNYLKMAQYSL